MKLFRVLHKKFNPAFTGLLLGVKERSIRLHLYIGIIVIGFSILFQFNIWEWIYVVLSIGLVITIEYLNSAVEKIVDYVSPECTEFAQKVKDLSAAAVLVISIFVMIGYLIIMGGKIF